MLASSDFYKLLTELFRQTARTPEVVPEAPPGLWPVGSAEHRLLADFQAAIKAVQKHSRQTEQVLEQQHEQAQAMAVLEERQRLAQNLHDAINQSLFSAGLIAEVLPRLWEMNPEEARQSLEDLRHLTRGAQAEMRGLLVELKPLILTDSVLADLLRQLAHALTGRTNIPVTVTVVGPEQQSLPAAVQVAFYRICQEALHNISKHAKANRVEVQLHVAAGAIELHIRDDGCGFDPTATPSGRYGLTMMRERAQSVAAVLTITSQPGEGTVVAITWAGNGVKE